MRRRASEVEIVPVQKGGAAPAPPEAAAPPGAQLPARIIRRDETLAAPRAAVRAPGPGKFGALMGDRKRRIRILLAALAALIVLVVAARGSLQAGRSRFRLLSRAQYRALADRAVELFQTDPAAAADQLRDLQQRPAEGNPKLAKILQEAFRPTPPRSRILRKATRRRRRNGRKSASPPKAPMPPSAWRGSGSTGFRAR